MASPTHPITRACSSSVKRSGPIGSHPGTGLRRFVDPVDVDLDHPAVAERSLSIVHEDVDGEDAGGEVSANEGVRTDVGEVDGVGGVDEHRSV